MSDNMRENDSDKKKVDRRGFLKLLGVAGAAAGAGMMLSKNIVTSPGKELVARAEASSAM